MSISAKFIIIVCCFLMLASCASTQNADDPGSMPISSKSWITTALGCLVAGSVSGMLAKKYSPNEASEGANMLLFGTLGCSIVGGASGYINHRKELESAQKKDKQSEYLYQNFRTPIGGHNE